MVNEHKSWQDAALHLEKVQQHVQARLRSRFGTPQAE